MIQDVGHFAIACGRLSTLVQYRHNTTFLLDRTDEMLWWSFAEHIFRVFAAN